jgi:uncharacterized protein YjbI with pentapeptide repeats
MSDEIWQRLVHEKSLGNESAPTIDGRLDLRNLHVPEPHAVETLRMPRIDVTVLSGITSIKGVSWQSIDFTGSQLPGLRFLDCQIRNCVFDRCRLDDLRVWRTDFANVSFRSADLRDAVLGGTRDDDSRRNTFQDVDFTAADMRGSIYGAAEFLRCKFNRAKLVKVDFQSSAFTDCIFEGELRGVLFYRKGFDCERFPPNEMKRVDLRRAKLRWSEFKGLDLDEVLFPEDDDHIVVDNFPQTLERLLAHFGARSDMGSQRLAACFEHYKKWLGTRQKVGVLNRRDLMESGGEEGLDAVMKIIGPAWRRDSVNLVL